MKKTKIEKKEGLETDAGGQGKQEELGHVELWCRVEWGKVFIYLVFLNDVKGELVSIHVAVFNYNVLSSNSSVILTQNNTGVKGKKLDLFIRSVRCITLW